MDNKTDYFTKNAILLVAIILLTSLSKSNVNGYRRRRCIYKNCWRCDIYVDGRHKRSIPDDASISDDLDVPFKRLQGNSRRTTWNEIRDMHDMRSVLVDKAINELQNNRKKFSNMEIEQRILAEKEGDSVMVDEVDVEIPGNHGIQQPLTGDKHARSYARKRSVRSYFRRCLNILNTKCCKRFLGTTTYIGYMIKRT